MTSAPQPDPTPDKGQPDFWSGRYESGDHPWDLGVPSPALEWALRGDAGERLFGEVSLEEDDRVLVPGCGRGYDLLPFARRGHHVVGVDFAEPAARAARTLLRRNGYRGEVLCEDVFGLGPEHDGCYAVVFDHTCLCALPRYLQGQYAQKVAGWLKPGGVLAHMAFPADPGRADDQGPPFRMLRSDCEGIFSGVLEPLDSRPPGPSHPNRWGLERLDLWVRRG